MHLTKKSLLRHFYLYTCMAFGPVVASERPTSRNKSTAQRERYYEELYSSEESSPGASIIAYHNPSVSLPAYDPNRNSLDQQVRSGEIHASVRNGLDAHQPVEPALQQGEPDPIRPKNPNQVKKELSDALTKLAYQQKSLKRRLAHLQQKNHPVQADAFRLAAYHNSLQLHEHKLNQWVAKLEALYALNEADPELHNLIDKADNLQDALDELTVAHHLLANPDVQPKSPSYLSCSHADPPANNDSNDVPKNLQKKKNKLKHKHAELQSQQSALKQSFDADKNSPGGKSLATWRKKFRNHTKALQAYKQALTIRSNQLQHEFFLKNWSNQQIRAIVAENTNLWKDFISLVKGKDELESLPHACAEQKMADPETAQQSQSACPPQHLVQEEPTQDTLTQWAKRLEKQQEAQANQAARLQAQQDQLTQWEQRLQHQQQLHDDKEIGLNNQQDELTRWQEQLKNQRKTQLIKQITLKNQQDQLRQWEQRLKKQQQLCASKEVSLMRQEDELRHWSTSLKKQQQTSYRKNSNSREYFAHEDAHPYLSMPPDAKQRLINRQYHQLYDEQTQLRQWQTKLNLDPNTKNLGKQYETYQERLQDHQKRLNLWDHALDELLGCVRQESVLQKLLSQQAALQNRLEKLTKNNYFLHP